jgi:hypothetical protein
MKEDYKRIELTGKVYIKYADDEESVSRGDLRLFLHDDTTNPFPGDYEYSGLSGYFKAEVYDGKFWQMINLDEFLENKENRFAKRQRPIETAMLCKEILEDRVFGETIFRTYRGHFTREEYIKEERVTKANRNRK